MNARWEEVVALATEQNERLTEQLTHSKDIYDRIEGTSLWLAGLKQDLANKDYAILSPSDLQVKIKKFKVSARKWLNCGFKQKNEYSICYNNGQSLSVDVLAAV